MTHEVSQDRIHPENWRVEAFDMEGTGECYIAIFSGAKAKGQAYEYANLKNSGETKS